MDHGDFDQIARSTADGASRRTLVRLLTGAAVGAAASRLGGADDAAASHKKRKKKGARCKTLRQSCGGGRCCGGLGCGNNGCASGAVCFQHEGGGCGRDCDCGGDLNCSERKNGTCQDCGYPESACNTTSDCCLSDSICGYNGCVGQTTCCQWTIGSLCYDDCDCCEELGCFGNACLPLLTADGGERRKETASAADTRSAKGRWPRR